MGEFYEFRNLDVLVGQGSQGKLGEIRQIGLKIRQKIGQKIRQKSRQKCDHTNSGRQFAVIEFTNLVEFMNVIL